MASWQRGGEQFTEVNVIYTVPHGGGGGDIVWEGISYGQLERFCDEILTLIVVPFICRHHYEIIYGIM
jgi:hypothetical protein